MTDHAPPSTEPTDTDGPLRLAVIVGSTRRGRAGAAIARWFVRQVEGRDDVALDFIDLAETDLPTVLPDFETEEVPYAVASLSVRIAAADAFVVVTPEYNHSFPASLKNAIDWFYDEWMAKPAALVSYGGRAGGVRATEQLRQVFAELHVHTTRDGVAINLDDCDDQGEPTGEGPLGAAKVALDQLTWWARALRDARAARTYGG